MLSAALLFLPVTGLMGWHFGRKDRLPKEKKPHINIPRDYFVGLNFLLNEQPDKAVDIFIKMLEVDSETVETHLALGSLFRRRGEVDRAIRMHQNLIARPNLAKQQKTQALLALGQDYLRAGFFDRAERLFLEVADGSEQVGVALRHLLTIYQQEKNWQQAVVVANKLVACSEENVHPAIAHYYCELADDARVNNQFEQAQKFLRQALTTDPNCVRASLLLAEIETLAGRYKNAIRYYENIKEQDPDYLSEIIYPLADCYEKLAKEIDFYTFLQKCLQKHPRISIVLAMADYLQRRHGQTEAVNFIAEQLRVRPSVRGLQRLISLNLMKAEGAAKDNLLILHDLTINLLRSKPIYRCQNCGFNGRVLHWLCPSCKKWSTVKPIHGLEGD